MSRTSCCRMCSKRDLPAIFARLKELGLATPNAGLDHRHHRLPRPRLLRSRQCALHPDRAGHRRALRRSRPPARDRRAEDQDLRLHQCLRPSSRRPYRHPRRRQEGRGISTSSSSAARARRTRASATSWARASASDEIGRRGRARGRRLSRSCAQDGERFLDTYRRVGMEPFKNVAYGRTSMPLIKFGAHSHDKNGQFVEDPFYFVPDGKAYPEDKGVIVTLARFQGEKENLLAHRPLVGVRLASSENPTVLKADLHRLAVVVLEFPKFRDGRAFSWARMLRTRLRLQGRNPRDRRFPARPARLHGAHGVRRFRGPSGFDAGTIPPRHDRDHRALSALRRRQEDDPGIAGNQLTHQAIGRVNHLRVLRVSA